MKNTNKFNIYITKIDDNNFSGKISRSPNAPFVFYKEGFKTHFEAEIYLEEECQKLEPPYNGMSFFDLAKHLSDSGARAVFTDKVNELYEDLLFDKIVTLEISEKEAQDQVQDLIGRSFDIILSHAKNRTLDALVDLHEEEARERTDILMDYADTYIPTDEAMAIMKIILRIPGHKIISVILGNSVEYFDIISTGQIGYTKEHANTFAKLIEKALETEATLVIKQFIPDSEELAIDASGNARLMPWKAVYAMVVSLHGIFPLVAEQVEAMHSSEEKDIYSDNMIIYKDILDFIYLKH